MSDPLPILAPVPTGERGRFGFTARPEFCVGAPEQPFLFGGAGLGAAISAAEQHTGRRLVQAAAQYLSFAGMGEELELEVEELVAGKSVSQVRVSARSGARVIYLAHLSLGDRSGQPEVQWFAPPEMPAPEDCPAGPIWPRQGGKLHQRLELRLHPDDAKLNQFAGEVDPAGRVRLWIRDREGARLDAPLLAMMGDFVPTGAALALGRVGGGNSLDNTLRLCALEPSDWVLCDIHLGAAARGFLHGQMRMFSQGGRLLATGSQSLILRNFEA